MKPFLTYQIKPLNDDEVKLEVNDDSLINKIKNVFTISFWYLMKVLYFKRLPMLKFCLYSCFCLAIGVMGQRERKVKMPAGPAGPAALGYRS